VTTKIFSGHLLEAGILVTKTLNQTLNQPLLSGKLLSGKLLTEKPLTEKPLSGNPFSGKPWAGKPLSGKCSHRRFWLSCLAGLGFVLSPGLAIPAQAAERIYIRYFILERSLSVADLEAYAKTGKPSQELAAYLRLLKPEQRQQMLQLLRERIELNQVTVAQFMDSPIGERLVERLGRFVQDGTRQPNREALKAALILAAGEPEGVTLVNLMRQFPGPQVYLNLDEGFALFNTVEQLVNQTNAALAAVRQQSQRETVNLAPWSASMINGLGQPGSIRWQKLSLQLQDKSPQRLQLTQRPRNFVADIYVPLMDKRQPRPVIVISHGLGSNPQTYAYLAQHFASLGFVVAVPEHPGSSTTQLQGLITGQLKDVADPNEFIDRPLDIKFLLDELKRRSPSHPLLQGRVDVEQVGLVGQSFGGYTVLALAGAKPDVEHWQSSCNPNIDESLNVSLLLQCQVLRLPQQAYDFSDPRIKAVIAINPLTSALFGPSGLRSVRVPVMIIASGADTVAPPLAEQVRPFTWLPTNIPRYLVVIENASHFSTLGETEGSAAVTIPSGFIGPTPELARNYLRVLGNGFMQTHLANQLQFAPALTAATMRNFSHFPLPISLSRQFSPELLTAALQPKPRSQTRQQSDERRESTPANQPQPTINPAPRPPASGGKPKSK
jgi:predicted dienelactone hydrolase